MNSVRVSSAPVITKPRHLAARQLTTEQQRWQAYEAAKHLWECQNPGASCDEHEQAMRAIAMRLGV